MGLHKKLLTLNDLYTFYNTKTAPMVFDSNQSGYSIAVQTHANFELSEDLSEGLLYGTIRAFHDLSNENKSYIETDIFNEKILSIKDRPIVADIVETNQKDENGNYIKDFAGHTMEYDEENNKINYIELPIGHFTNFENLKTEFDEDLQRHFVISDVVIYEEYTDACEILRRRKKVDCSVELAIRKMHWDNEKHVLYLDDFYVQGCTLLGKDYQPGMKGSALTLKDFSQDNNSAFLSETNFAEIVNKLNTVINTIGTLNENIQLINNTTATQEGGHKTDMKIEEFLKTYGKTKDDIPFDTTGMTEDAIIEQLTQVFENENSAENHNDTTEDVFIKTYELSNEDIRTTLYKLLIPIEEEKHCWIYIIATFADYFIYQIHNKKNVDTMYKQKFVIQNNSISFDGEPIEVFMEYLTAEEKSELDNIRTNYPIVVTELHQYKEKEDLEDKRAIFIDAAYANYLNTEEFVSLMQDETLKKFSKEELIEKADAALGKLVKMSKTFSLKPDENIQSNAHSSFVAFSKNKENKSFLDGLLNTK